MSNMDKDKMLQAAESVKRPQARLAAYLSAELPGNLARALVEMEMIQ